MAKGAISIHIFPSSILAFIFLCSITILADPKPPDPDIPIAIENGRNGNLGEWEHFVQQAYQISSQCYRVPEQNTIFSNRLHVRCKQEPQADGASLLVCYPSVLDSDPDAFPDEDDEGLTPALQPTMMESVTVDPKSNITIECNELMEKCKSTPKCPMPKMAKKWGEKWHGFRVTRRRDGFQIELPFGNGDGNDTKIDVPDLDNEGSQFFINLAREQNLLTEIIRGSISDPKESTDKRKYTVVDKKEQQKFRIYNEARKWGIDLNDVKGLWMLAMDILPVGEKQLFKEGQEKEIDEPMIRWFTKSKPAIRTTEECVEIYDKLQMKDITKEYYIVAQYLTPSTADPHNDGFFTNDHKQGLDDPKEIIELKENGSRIENFEILDGTRIRIRAQSTKGKFTIKLLIGFKRENEYLGERIFTMVMDFNEIKPMDQCYIMDNNNNKIACNNELNPFLRANDTGSAFWFQLEFKGGTEIHFNFDCVELIVPVKKIPYSKNSFIKFEGDMKLIKDENDKLLKIKEGNEMENKFPTLTITKLEHNLTVTVNHVLYLTGLTRINSQIKITFVKLDNDEQTDQKSLISRVEVNVENKGSISAKWNENTKPVKVDPNPNQGINTSVLLFSVIFSRNDKNKFLLTINGKQISSESDARDFNYIQVSGDILLINSPTFLQNVAGDYNETKQFDTMVRHDVTHVPVNSDLIFFIIPSESSVTGESKINIILGCSICSKSKNALSLTVDLKKKIINAQAYEYIKKARWVYEWSHVGGTEPDQALATNLFGQPIWLVIKQKHREDNDEGEYSVFINGNNELVIRSYNQDKNRHYTDFDEISLQGDFFLFNKIIPFPLRFTMKNEKADKLPLNLNISVKGMVMSNAKLLEFFLATPKYDENADVEKYNDIMQLGTAKFNGTVHLHVRVKQERKINEICIQSDFIQGPCKASIHDKSPFINNQLFSLELSGKQWNNETETLSVKINEKPFEVKGKEDNFNFDAMYLVIMGDMVLFDSPKCEPECPNKRQTEK